jgi:hypothetical protein
MEICGSFAVYLVHSCVRLRSHVLFVLYHQIHRLYLPKKHSDSSLHYSASDLVIGVADMWAMCTGRFSYHLSDMSVAACPELINLFLFDAHCTGIFLILLSQR